MFMLGPTYHQLNRLQAANEIELHDQVRNVLRLLHPQRAVGHTKARFGSVGDGGYVHLDDFAGVDTAVSMGISDDINWDLAVADRGLTVHQFDHTVDAPAPHDPRLIFSKSMIGPQAGPGVESFESIVARLDKRRERPNLLLKMDIECSEWEVIEATSLQTISRFTQITCELHGFEALDRLEWRQLLFRCLRKLSKVYAPIHVHANNYAGFRMIANVPVSAVIEVTFANRALYRFEQTDEIFPTALDHPCDLHRPDMYLGSFAY